MDLFLKAIWLISASLAVFSIVVALYLALRHAIRDFLDAREEARRQKIKSVLFDAVDSRISQRDATTLLKKFDQADLLDVAGPLRRTLKGNALEALDNLLNSLIDVDYVIGRMKSGSTAVRAALYADMAWIDDRRIYLALTSALHDPAPQIVLAAAYALTETSAGLPLQTAWIRMTRDDMIGHLGVRQLFRKLAKTQSKAIRGMLYVDDRVALLAADALATSDDFECISDLSALALEHRSSDVRAACVRAVVELRHPSGSNAVISSLNDPVWTVRTQAAIAAGRMGLSEAADTLSVLMSDESWWVRFRAAESLVQLGPSGISALNAVKEAGIARDVAVYALQEAGRL